MPSEIIDQIGGWLTHGVGNSYGNGYKTLTVYKWMNKSFFKLSQIIISKI